MTQPITQAVSEAAKGAIMAIREAKGPAKSRMAVQAVLGTSGPTLRKLTFDFKA